MHAIILLAGLITTTTHAPTINKAPTFHYGSPGQSRVGAHRSYGFRLNHDAPQLPTVIVKAW